MKPSCVAFGAFPQRGRHPWPGEASSTVALGWGAPVSVAAQRCSGLID